LESNREDDQLLIEYLKRNTKLFDERRTTNHCQQPKPSFHYEASPLPPHVAEELLPKIEAEKAERRQRLWEHSNEMYIDGFWKTLKEPQSTAAKGDSVLLSMYLNEHCHHQIRANEVPNFAELQRKFAEELQSRKQTFKPTKVKEFHFGSPTPKRRAEPSPPSQPHFKSQSPPKDHGPTREVRSTQKYDDWVAFNHARMAEKELRQLDRQREAEERLLKQRNFAKFMRKNLDNCTDNTALLRQRSEEKLRRYRRHIAELSNQTEDELAQIYARVLERPFLFEEAAATAKPTEKHRPKRPKGPTGAVELHS
jgi:hypothetical protein